MNPALTLWYSSFGHETRPAQGVAALELGDGMIAVVTSRLAALLEQTGILPFS